MKGGGGHRLVAWATTLVAVCPVVEEQYYTNNQLQAQARLDIKLFDLSQILTQRKPEQGKDEMQELELGEHEQQEEELEPKLLCPIFEEMVEGANPRLPYSYLACDQKGPNIVLLFSKQFTGMLIPPASRKTLFNPVQVHGKSKPISNPSAVGFPLPPPFLRI